MKFEVVHPKDYVKDDQLMERHLFNQILAGIYLGTTDICIGYGSVAIKSPYGQLTYKKLKTIDEEQIKTAMEGKCNCLLPERCELGTIVYREQTIIVIAKYQKNQWAYILREMDTEFAK